MDAEPAAPLLHGDAVDCCEALAWEDHRRRWDAEAEKRAQSAFVARHDVWRRDATLIFVFGALICELFVPGSYSHPLAMFALAALGVGALNEAKRQKVSVAPSAFP